MSLFQIIEKEVAPFQSNQMHDSISYQDGENLFTIFDRNKKGAIGGFQLRLKFNKL